MSALFDELTRMTKLHAYVMTGDDEFLKDMPPMPSMPCSVTADLSRHQRQVDRNERESAATLHERVEDAQDRITDAAALKKLLDDEVLAKPLADAMLCIDEASRELAALEAELNVTADKLTALKVLLQANTRTQYVLFNMAMEATDG